MNKLKSVKEYTVDFSVLENMTAFESFNDSEKINFAGNAVQEISSYSALNKNTEVACILKDLIKNVSEYGKYDKYISVLNQGFPYEGIKIKEAYIRHKENELWIIAEYVDSAISENFFNIAFDLWDDLYTNVNIVLAGENELNRALMPDDLESVVLQSKEV